MGLRTTISRVFSSLLKGVTALGAKAVTGPIKDVSGAAKDVTGIRKDLVETKLAQYEVQQHESLIQKATLKDVETYDDNLRHLLEAVSKLDRRVHDFPYPQPPRPPFPL